MPQTTLAPVVINDHMKRPACCARVWNETNRDKRRALVARLLADVLDGDLAVSEVDGDTLSLFTMSDLTAIGKMNGLKGMSGLTKGELVEFIRKGVKPAARPESTRAVKEAAAKLKASGKLTGPVSALRVDDLRKAVSAAEKVADGESAHKVVKPAAKAGSTDEARAFLKACVDMGLMTRPSSKTDGFTLSTLKAEAARNLAAKMGWKAGMSAPVKMAA